MPTPPSHPTDENEPASRAWRWLVLLGCTTLVACGPGISSLRRSCTIETPLPGWQKIHAGGRPGTDSPRAGEDGEIVYDGTRHRLLLYGGKGDDDVNIDELWAFDVKTRRWNPIRSEGPHPPPREDHSLILDTVNDQLVLYGGEDGLPSRETWSFSLGDGRWTDITDDSSPAREDHTAIYDAKRQRMIVFGGTPPSPDTWALDLDLKSPDYGTWMQLPTRGPDPAVRRRHGAAYDSVRDRMIVYGGRTPKGDKNQYLADVWALDLEALQWSELSTTGDSPGALNQTVLSYDPTTDELIAFGGEVVVTVQYDTEEYLTNSVWVLDLNSLTWSERSPYPRPVYDHAGVYVPEYGGTVIYGGQSHRPVKERSVWLLEISPPAPGAPE